MIAVELQCVICDEPGDIDRHGQHRPTPTPINAGSSQWERVVYLPQLAIVVARHRGGHRLIVPVEHVWHMTATAGPSDLLADLAQVFA